MIARLSLISMLLVSSSMFGMRSEYESIAIELNELDSQPETTSKAHCISSLKRWKELIKKNTSLDDYEVLPKVVAKFQHTYDIKTDLPLLPEAIQAWTNIQGSDHYKQEVLRIDTLLRGGKDTQNNQELRALQNRYLKGAYETLASSEEELIINQECNRRLKPWAIITPIIAIVLWIGFIVELFSLDRVKNRKGI